MLPTLLSLLSFALIATISPGGATTLATASGAQFGLRRSLPLIAGIALGLGSLVGAVAAGLSTLLQAWPPLELWLRIGGSIYLLSLAAMIGRQGAPGRRPGASAPFGLFSGLLLLWINPKAWAMAVATASTYSGLSRSPLVLALVAGVVFAAAAASSLTLWCSGGAWLTRLIKTESQWRAVNITLALLLAASVALMWH